MGRKRLRVAVRGCRLDRQTAQRQPVAWFSSWSHLLACFEQQTNTLMTTAHSPATMDRGDDDIEVESGADDVFPSADALDLLRLYVDIPGNTMTERARRSRGGAFRTRPFPARISSGNTPDWCVLQCVAVCCSVLQCVAVCCSVLQRVAVCCSVLQCVAVCCSVLQCVAVCCCVLQHAALCCNMLHCVALCCNMLQCAAVCCSVLQCAAVCCRVLQGVARDFSAQNHCRSVYPLATRPKVKFLQSQLLCDFT